MGYDIAEIRARFPALRSGEVYLDGAAGTQVPEGVVTAIADAYERGIGNLGGAFRASGRSEEIVAECRRSIADLVGGEPQAVVLGPNMTTLTYRICAALSRTWGDGDDVVVSRLDHDANIRPWVQAAERAGARVLWAEFDAATGELPVEQYDELLSGRPRLVAVTAASNVIGTRPDVAAIAAKAHDAGALVFVDGVHATPHGVTDIEALGADFYVTSAYKWAGPHIGALIGRPEVLEDVRIDKLAPAPDSLPDRLELGTGPYADYAGVTAAVEHLASLDQDAVGDRRLRVIHSMTSSSAHEAGLLDLMLAGLGDLRAVTVYGRARNRTSTAFFNVAGRSPREVASFLAERGVNVWSGDNYAYELTGVLGIRATGGAVRASIVHYNDEADVLRFVGAVAAVVGSE
jgi:cysteine desulfurase family protein (TIGR01976 family)